MSDSRDLVERFADLFEGRKDAYGADWGECIRFAGTPEFGQRMWLVKVREHLNGTTPFGVYPIRTRSDIEVDLGEKRLASPREHFVVKWGCLDLDDNDLQAAINLRNALHVLDITAWIEVSKSKGYHVWVFAQGWVPAATMRRALLAAHDIAGVPAREVNPKQEKLEPNAFGNYVRLPYPGALTGQDPPVRQAVLIEWPTFTPLTPHEGRWARIPLSAFIRNAEMARTPGNVLKAAADLYVPPPEPKPVVVRTIPKGSLEHALSRLNGLAFTIWEDGPLEGGDRSGTLYKLAVNAFDSGLTPSEVFAVVQDADMSWGKFSERADGQKQLERIVARAASA